MRVESVDEVEIIRRMTEGIYDKSEMPVTLIRLNLVKGLGPVMQIAEGWTVNLTDDVSDKLWKRTSSDLPHGTHSAWIKKVRTSELPNLRTPTYK